MGTAFFRICFGGLTFSVAFTCWFSGIFRLCRVGRFACFPCLLEGGVDLIFFGLDLVFHFSDFGLSFGDPVFLFFGFFFLELTRSFLLFDLLLCCLYLLFGFGYTCFTFFKGIFGFLGFGFGSCACIGGTCLAKFFAFCILIAAIGIALARVFFVLAFGLSFLAFFVFFLVFSFGLAFTSVIIGAYGCIAIIIFGVFILSIITFRIIIVGFVFFAFIGSFFFFFLFALALSLPCVGIGGKAYQQEKGEYE